MLNLITKILVGAAVALTATVTVAVVIDEKNKKKYAELGASEAPEDDTNDQSIKEKIKRAAKRMVEFVIDHQRELTAISLVIGLADAFVQLNTHLPSKGTGIKKQKTKTVALSSVKVPEQPVVNNDPVIMNGPVTWTNESGEHYIWIDTTEDDLAAFMDAFKPANATYKMEVL